MSSIFKEQNKSIFNIRELNSKELKGRIILLNVYNIKDFSYIFSVDLANRYLSGEKVETFAPVELKLIEKK